MHTLYGDEIRDQINQIRKQNKSEIGGDCFH
jgi:hypothetical protein